MAEAKRLFLGGLAKDITEKDLTKRFGKFGQVDGVDIKVKRGDTGDSNTFAYLNINITTDELQKCVKLYHNSKWKGKELHVEVAKASFLDRLKAERQEAAEGNDIVEDVDAHEKIRSMTVDSAHQGTPVENMRNWVVGDNGQVLPVVYIRQKDKQKVMKYDPTKYTHTNKTMDVEGADGDTDVIDTPVENLTWQLEERKTNRNPDSSSLSAKHIFEQHQSSSGTVDFVSASNHSSSKVADYDSSDDNISSKPKKIKLHKASGKDKSRNVQGACSDSSDDTDDLLSKQKARIKKRKLSKPVKTSTRAVFKDSPVKSAAFGSDSEGLGIDEEVSPLPKWLESESDSESERKIPKKKSKKSKKDKSKEPEQLSNDSESERKIPKKKSKKSKKDKSKEPEQLSNSLRHKEKQSNSNVLASGDYDSSCDEVKKKKNLEKYSVETNKTDNKFSSDIQKGSKMASSEDSSGSELDVFEMIESGRAHELYKGESEGLEQERRQNRSTSSKDKSKGVKEQRKHNKSTSATSVGVKQENKHSTSTSAMLGVKQENKHNKSTGTSTKDMSEGVKEESRHNKSTSANDVSEGAKKQHRRNKSTAKNPFQLTKLMSHGKTEDSAIEIKSQSSKLRDEKGNDKSQRLKFLQMSAEQKHEVSNQMRLDSLRQREKEVKAKQAAVKKALADIDSKSSSNKKVVFDSDDDADYQVSAPDEVVASASMGSYTDYTDNDKEANKKETLPQLFASDSSDDDEPGAENHDDNRFKFRPEFEGKAGKKLLNLQARIGDDRRFKLDARFAEAEPDEGSDSEGEEDELKESTGASERDTAMKILEDVVGSKALQKMHREKKSFRDITTLQYDPSRKDHEQFELDMTKKKKKFKKKSKEEHTAEPASGDDPVDELPEVSKDRFFEVSANLGDVFKKPEDKETSTNTKPSFSLLSMFGKVPESKAKGTNDQEERTIEPATKSPWPNPMIHDSSDEEEPGPVSEDHNRVSSQKEAVLDVFKPKKDKFFFQKNDSSIQEALQQFRCQDETDTLREKWLETRQFHVDACKIRIKGAVRRRTKSYIRGERGRGRGRGRGGRR